MEIPRLLRNYGKDLASRKTKPYLEEKQNSFVALMRRITDRHDKLEPLKEALKGQPFSLRKHLKSANNITQG